MRPEQRRLSPFFPPLPILLSSLSVREEMRKRRKKEEEEVIFFLLR